ncbi:MAG TPA: alpha-isopropylmalate synthase regulatory domain-containing protein, partial [Aestuariivirga sp.]|nr:alpha-isopropylmalate synthase regulatory domain-containing protein [Aestuariivirga sp.]
FNRFLEAGGEGANRWFTVGVSANIVEASFQALLDAITFKLVKAGVTPENA